MNEPDVNSLADRIVAKFHPARIVLYGSRAYGRPRPDSDVDILVVMPFEGSAFRQALEIANHLDLPYSLDVIVRSPEDVERRYRFGDPLIREAIDRGRVLYEAAA